MFDYVMNTNTLIFWTIIIGYILFIFIKGVLKGKKVQTTDDFLIAGRNVGWFFLFCTMGATVIGGGASIGAIGKTYEWGLLMVFISGGWYLHFIFSGLIVAPKFRGANLYTVAGYFGYRFGEGPRLLMMMLSLIFSVFILAAQMAAFGSVVSSVLPEFLNKTTLMSGSIIIGGTMVVIYCTAGGLMAVIQTDVYQFIILLVGLAITMLFSLPDLIESWSTIHQTIPSTFFQPAGDKGWPFLLTTFLAFFLGETFAPGYATRYCVGKNIKETRWGIAGVGIFLALIFPLILFVIALYARLHFPNGEPQAVLPLVIKNLNNPIIAGLLVGALIMAVMSSADSALNSATAIFTKDLFEHQLKWKDLGDGRMLRLSRICSAGLGVISIAIAAFWHDVIEILLFTYHLWAPTVFLPICIGVFSKKKSPILSRHILVTMIVSILATMIYRWTPYKKYVDPTVCGVLISCLTFFSLRVWQFAQSRDSAAARPQLK